MSILEEAKREVINGDMYDKRPIHLKVVDDVYVNYRGQVPFLIRLNDDLIEELRSGVGLGIGINGEEYHILVLYDNELEPWPE